MLPKFGYAYACKSISNIYACVCINMNIHVTRLFPPFCIDASISPPNRSSFKEIPSSSNHKLWLKTFLTYLPDIWNEPTGEDQIKSIVSHSSLLFQKVSQSSHIIQGQGKDRAQKSLSKRLESKWDLWQLWLVTYDFFNESFLMTQK